jgi:hypothetical protein
VKVSAVFLFLAVLVLATLACGDSDDSSGPNFSGAPTVSPVPDPGPCTPNLEASPPPGGLTWEAILPAEIAAPPGWTVRKAEGEGRFLEVSDDQQVVGTVELLALPLSSLTETAFNPQRGLADLQVWAEAMYNSVREDRELTFGETYVFEQDEPEPGDAGQLCAVRYAFRGTFNDEVQDRVVGYATYDSSNLYLFVAQYDAADAAEGIGFRDARELEEYAPFLGELVTALSLPP